MRNMPVTDALVGQRRRVVIIEGEAGVGKARLITEVLAGLPARQERVLVTRCPPMRVPFTLGALVETISRRPCDAVEFGLLAGALRPLFPEWADRLPPALAPAEDRGMERHRSGLRSSRSRSSPACPARGRSAPR